MKLESTGWKVSVFIGGLLISALLVDFFFFNKAATRHEAKAQEQRQAATETEARQTTEKLAQAERDAEAKRDRDEAQARANAAKSRKIAADNAAAEHALLLARYLNSGFTRKPDVATVGVTIESEEGTVDPNIGTALVQHLGASDIQVLNSFFRPDFVAGKCVDSILSGDTSIFDRLELTNWLNGVLIGRESVSFSINTDLGSTTTASLRLQLVALPVGSMRASQSWTFSATGVGFNTSDARKQAEDRIVHQIANDQTMSLSTFSPQR